MPRFYINELSPQEPPYTCEIAAFPIAVVPFALGALEQRAVRYVWRDEQSWLLGHQLVRELQVSLLTGCLDELLESNNRIYRLLDSALYGTLYNIQIVDGKPVIMPEIPETPSAVYTAPGLLQRAQRIERVLDNGINGTLYDDFQSTTAMRNQLAQIIELLQNGDGEGLDPEILAELVKIAGLLV